jgi:hypothetical protein
MLEQGEVKASPPTAPKESVCPERAHGAFVQTAQPPIWYHVRFLKCGLENV